MALPNLFMGGFTMRNTECVSNGIQVNDWVISIANNLYSHLVGRVCLIEKLNTEEHDTDNISDDIHVNFSEFDYSVERIKEIEEWHEQLTGESIAFTELPLDDVIMAPDMLICISGLSDDRIQELGNCRQNCEEYCRYTIRLDMQLTNQQNCISA